MVRILDSDWLRAHPIPWPENGADKNSRGRVLVVGGSRIVPGGLQLTIEAALRAGAGKVQVAAPRSISLALGIAMPEAAVFDMGEGSDGEIALAEIDRLDGLLERSDAVVAGPAMSNSASASGLAGHLISSCDKTLVFDAGTLMALGRHAPALRARESASVLTPHIGELAAMLSCSADEIDANRCEFVREASLRFQAICVLKGSKTLIAAPDGAVYSYTGGGVGLATGGSGDVLAGIVTGLCARGVDPLQATLWAVWLHGEAGRRCAERIGPIGFLARELLTIIPGLMRDV